jgi:Zn-dependent membrane protease YugP
MLSFLFFDPLLSNPAYLIAMVLGFGISMWAQSRVKSTFLKYSKVGVQSGMTGAEAAAAVCRSGGVEGVTIERSSGFLSDHYDPRARALRLSPDVYDGRSVSAIAVAAHEAGHSIQHATDYAPLGWRSAFVPVANIGGRAWYFVFVIGLLLQSGESMLGPTLMQIGIILFAALVFFQLLTLPVEFDASKRAKAVLVSTGIVSNAEEEAGVAKVLDAAAMTYVAAAAASIMTLIALLMRSGNNN